MPGDPVPDRQPDRQRRQGPAVATRQVPAPVDLGRAHRDEGDVRRAEGGTVEQRVEGPQHRVVRPPVGQERPSGRSTDRPRRPGGRYDVGTPEGVDGLLGVPDQHQGRPAVGPVEQGREDLPLDRVGVLELIDQRHPEAAPEGRHGAVATRAAQRVTQLGEHVVEAERPALPPARGTPGPRLRSTRSQEQDVGRGGTGLVRASAPGRDRVGRRPAWWPRRGRPDAGRHRRAPPATAAAMRTSAQVVPDQVGRVGDRAGVGVGAGRDAEGAEHLLGEPVDRGDRGGVELGDGARESGQLVRVAAGRTAGSAERRPRSRGDRPSQMVDAHPPPGRGPGTAVRRWRPG